MNEWWLHIYKKGIEMTVHNYFNIVIVLHVPTILHPPTTVFCCDTGEC